MRPVSAEFLRTIRGSHTMTARARVVEDFTTGVNPDGTTIAVLSGSVTADATADIRATLDLTTDGTGMWPRRADDLLAPYGNELFVERGVEYGNGVTEWVSLGYYRIQAPTQDRVPDGPIRITALDRMAGIRDARLLAPRQFGATATLGDVIHDLVTEVYPDAVIEWDDGTDADLLGRRLTTEDDRLKFCADLVKAAGKIWYFDHRGVLVITDPPNPADPVFDVTSGEDGVLVEMSRELTRERVYNAVVASGEAPDTDNPARGVAIDNDPSSPTYFYGRFGPVPQFYTSPFLTSNSQAARAAVNMLRPNLGLPYSVDFAAVPNPALEPYDPVRIRYSNRDTIETHVLDSVTIGLTAAEPMTATTREQTRVLIGTS